MTREETVRPGSQSSAKLAARAILIILVMIGHNRILHDHFYYSLYIFIYAFHVGAFFLLAALSPPRTMDRASLANLLRKIVAPFLIFTAIYAVLAQAADVTRLYSGWPALPLHYLAAISLANTWILDAVTGLKMLWFLPAFFVFCLLYNVYGSLKGWFLAPAIVIAAAAHLFVGELPMAMVEAVPWGANIVAYLLLPSLLFALIEPRIERHRAAQILCVLLFAAASAFALHNRYELILSESIMPSLRRPIALVVGDLQLLSGTATCLIVGRYLGRSHAVRTIGANSMKLYLLHPLVNVAALKLFQPHLPWMMAMVLVSTATVIGTALLIGFLDRATTPVRTWLFG